MRPSSSLIPRKRPLLDDDEGLGVRPVLPPDGHATATGAALRGRGALERLAGGAGERADRARAGEHAGGELERVVRTQLDEVAVIPAAARGAQRIDRFGQRELFADVPATKRPPRISPRASMRRSATAARARAARAIRARRRRETRRPSARAAGARRRSGSMRSVAEASSVQRPLDERGRARRPFSPRRRFASISERSASKPSAVTRPAATSCQSASSTSAGKPLRAAHDVGEERRAAPPDLVEHLARGVRERRRVRRRRAR